MKAIILTALLALTLTPSLKAQTWLPSTIPFSELEGDGLKQWFEEDGIKVKMFPMNYVGYVECVNEAKFLMADAGTSIYRAETFQSIIPDYLEDEDLTSSPLQFAVSVGSAKVVRTVEVDGWRIMLALTEETYSVAVYPAND